MRKLLIATKNDNKFKEVSKILENLDFEFVSLSDFSDIESVKETGKTFKENAEKKAIIYSEKTDSLAIADDSGLTVEHLNGKPGVFSSRFAGENATDDDNNDKLILMLENVPFEKRQASFICYIAIVDSGKLLGGCKGECNGYIAMFPRGEAGFGYDPLFIPDGYDKTFAELGEETKNKLSHRYKALIKTKEKLQNLT